MLISCYHPQNTDIRIYKIKHYPGLLIEHHQKQHQYQLYYLTLKEKITATTTDLREKTRLEKCVCSERDSLENLCKVFFSFDNWCRNESHQFVFLPMNFWTIGSCGTQLRIYLQLQTDKLKHPVKKEKRSGCSHTGRLGSAHAYTVANQSLVFAT